MQVMNVIFRGINLPSTLRNIDLCVAAAHSTSSYKGWMKRPRTKYRQRLVIKLIFLHSHIF